MVVAWIAAAVLSRMCDKDSQLWNMNTNRAEYWCTLMSLAVATQDNAGRVALLDADGEWGIFEILAPFKPVDASGRGRAPNDNRYDRKRLATSHIVDATEVRSERTTGVDFTGILRSSSQTVC
jgi:hypothetical protein